MPPFVVAETKKRDSPFQQPKHGQSTDENNTSMQGGNGFKVTDYSIHSNVLNG